MFSELFRIPRVFALAHQVMTAGRVPLPAPRSHILMDMPSAILATPLGRRLGPTLGLLGRRSGIAQATLRRQARTARAAARMRRSSAASACDAQPTLGAPLERRARATRRGAVMTPFPRARAPPTESAPRLVPRGCAPADREPLHGVRGLEGASADRCNAHAQTRHYDATDLLRRVRRLVQISA